VNIELDGKAAILAGADGALASAIADALAANGATVSRLDPATSGPRSGESDAPFVLVFVSRGAGATLEADGDASGDRQAFSQLAKQFAPATKRIVNVFSAAGLVPVKGLPEFSAGQAGIASLTRTLAMEFGPRTFVNAVAVGAYEAGGVLHGPRLLSHTAVKRPARIDEIVAAVLFLADPDNTYMTGHTLTVDGGWAAGYARNF
jgi:NAD(P)-dependent dehydrogenase (short-subunit alcohol dehydrogenase family)